MGRHGTMRLAFLLTILLLPFLLVLPACGGGGQEEAVLVQDAEAIALQSRDVPISL